MDLVSWLLLLTLSPVAAYVIGAVVHILIDQVHGKKLVDRYYATTKRDMIDPAIKRLEERIVALGRYVEVAMGQTAKLTESGMREQLERVHASVNAEMNAAIGRIEARLENEPPVLDQLEPQLEAATGRALDAFLRSDAGKEWSRELGNYVQTQIEEAFVQRTSSLAGSVARRSQSEIERLLEGAISFGNPILDGLWAAVPREAKRSFVNRLARVMRQRGAMIVSSQALPEGSGEIVPELEAGPEDPSGGWYAPP